jgi:hypothetical protein
MTDNWLPQLIYVNPSFVVGLSGNIDSAHLDIDVVADSRDLDLHLGDPAHNARPSPWCGCPGRHLRGTDRRVWRASHALRHGVFMAGLQ